MSSTVTRRVGAKAAGRDGSGTDTAGRTLRRPRSLPGSRAVVGGLLVAVAAVGVFAAYTDATAGPQRSWVVAARPVAAGQRLSAADLVTVPVDLPEQVAANAYGQVEPLVDAVAVGPLEPFELVQGSDVVVSNGFVAGEEISFRVESSRALHGTLQAGERVDVLATYGTGEGAFTVPVVRQALVLAAQSTGGDLGGQNDLVLRLGVDDAGDSLAIAHAVAAGQLAVIRTTAGGAQARGAADAYRPTPPGEATGTADVERSR